MSTMAPKSRRKLVVLRSGHATTSPTPMATQRNGANGGAADCDSRALPPWPNSALRRSGPLRLALEGALDRAGLAALVFNDGDALKALNGIVHPAVRAEMRRQVEEHRNTDRVVVMDVPLMVEGGRRRYNVGGVIVVDVPVDVAVERLVRFRAMDQADARARIGRQVSREERLAVADRVIDNSGDRESLAAQVDEVWA